MAYSDPYPGVDPHRARHSGAAPEDYPGPRARYRDNSGSNGNTGSPGYGGAGSPAADRGPRPAYDAAGPDPERRAHPRTGTGDQPFSGERAYAPRGAADQGYPPGSAVAFPFSGAADRPYPSNGSADRGNPPTTPGGPAGGPEFDDPDPAAAAYTADTAPLPVITPRTDRGRSRPDDHEDPPPRRRGPGKRRAGAGRPPTADKPSRAGRNLPAAIAVGVTLGAVLLASLYVYKLAFLGLLAVAVVVGVWEVSRATREVDAHPPAVPLAAGGVLMVVLAWYAGVDALLLGLLVTVLAATVWRLADGLRGLRRDLTAAALIAVYVPFLGGFAALLAVPDTGAQRLLVTLIAVVLSDTGGYAAGVFLGRHPMAPSVSPKKSWEGFGGSLVAAAVGSALTCYFLLDVELWWGAVFGVAISVAAVLGDLAESLLKRDLGIKDMSRLLPGHGGLMDRLDSILFALPTAYLLLSLFAPVR